MDLEAFNQPLSSPPNHGVIFPDIVSGSRMQKARLALPPEMIIGILAQGEKGQLAGGSKSFKTWALIQQALCISAGIPWWGFSTVRGNVIFLNLEIPEAFFEQRVRTVARALAIDVPEGFYVWHLRYAKLGDLSRWPLFLRELKKKCLAIANPFLTSDPIYKLLGGRNENSAGDVAQLLEQLDDMVEATKGANFFGHHFAKGSPSNKEAIDRASGSGVFQRDPDSIFMMSPHESDGAFTVDAILRNHPPIDPFVVAWRYPLFERVDADPEALRQPKTAKANRYDLSLFAKLLGNECLSTRAFCRRVMDETGMSRSSFYALKIQAENLKLIAYDHIAKTWERYRSGD